MQREACRQWSAHVSKPVRINRTSQTARSKYLRESWRPGLLAKKKGGGGGGLGYEWEGGRSIGNK